jgi:ubiquinone/menaquinone biosynthesis C-methylase UbiE
VSGRTLAQSFGNVAALYDRVRPEYSKAALDRLCSELGLGPESQVLDLAAGTGKLTRPLARRFDRLVAVEPDDDMRSMLLLPGVQVIAGTAERIPLVDAAVDAVFIGEAFHWFDGPAALAEIARVLRPGGGLALIWKQWWATEPPIPAEALALLNEPFERSGRAAKPARGESWREAFSDSAFEPLHEETLSERAEVDADRLVDLYLTGSSIAVLSDDERAALSVRLRQLLSGRYRVPIRVELAWTQLSP